MENVPSATSTRSTTVSNDPAAKKAVQPSGLSGSLHNLAAGTLSALVTLSYSIGYGALVFSAAELQPHLNTGLHCALMAAWLVALVVALGSSFHFSIAGPDSNATAILAVMAASVAATLKTAKASSAEIDATVWIMLVASAVLVGSLVYILGALRGGRLVRFLPYPVVGGFLAGTGFLIFSGAYKLLTGQELIEIMAGLPSIHKLAWIVAAAVAGGLLLLPRFIKHVLLMPVIIAAGVLIFYAGLLVFKLNLEDARAGNLMFRPLSTSAQMPSLVSVAHIFGNVRWPVLLSEWENFLAMTVVVIVTILLNATGLDLATREDVDFDRELRVNGVANIISGLGGGMIGYLSISRSLLNFKAGAGSRLAGIWTAVLCLAAAYVFTPVVFYFPKPVLAGLLLFLGLSMLRQWVWDSYSKLPLFEYALIVLILVLIAFQGLITGVIFGLLVASLFFVYSYSRTSCIKHNFSTHTHFSNKERSFEQTTILQDKGKAARALALQGYLFFGTSSAIMEVCRELIAKEDLRFLILDFRLVQGLDTSAMLSFTKLEQVCSSLEVRLAFSGLRADLEEVFIQARFLPNPKIKVFSDLDRGLEWIEDDLLGVHDAPTIIAPMSMGGTQIIAEMDLRRILKAHFNKPSVDAVIGYCEQIKLAEGSLLFRRGDPGNALYFIERGEVSVMLTLDDGQKKRLRSFGPGTIVGEMALYSHHPRSADVIADMDCRMRKLSAENLQRMEREHPEVAIQFHIFVVKLLASRLAAANDEIRALL